MLTHELATCSCEVRGCEKTQFSLRNFGLPARCKYNLRSILLLRGADWYLVTDVSGQHISPIFKNQVVQRDRQVVPKRRSLQICGA